MQNSIDSAVEILENKISKKYRKLRRLKNSKAEKHLIEQLKAEIKDLKNELEELADPDQLKFKL